MAWTKPTFYISLIFIVLIVFTSLGLLGTSLINSDKVTLNGDSIDYIATLKGISTESGYEDIADKDSAETESKGILDSDDNKSVSSTADYLASLYIKKERASQSINYFKLVYHIPTSIIVSLGLPLSNFINIINIFGWVLFISILFMIWTKFINP